MARDAIGDYMAAEMVSTGISSLAPAVVHRGQTPHERGSVGRLDTQQPHFPVLCA